jgi:hypothetical protein
MFKNSNRVYLVCPVCKSSFSERRGDYDFKIKRGQTPERICCCGECSYSLRRHNPKENTKTPCPFSRHLSQTKNRAKKSKKVLEFNITLEYIKQLWEEQQGRCALTGIPMVHPLRKDGKNVKEKSLFSGSIDRIDNDKGYIVGNIQFVTMGANYLKNDRTDDAALFFLGMMVENFQYRSINKIISC